jgi:HSP20 family protein
MSKKKQIQVHKGHAQQPVTLRDAMNRVFDESFWHPFGSFFDDPFFNEKETRLTKSDFHAIDLSETDKEVKVKIDIPGYDPENINVDIDGNVLTVSGEMSEEKEEKDEKFYRKERSSGHFSRSITLPNYIEAEKAECDAKNGSLEITVPKKNHSGKKSIKVNVK